MPETVPTGQPTPEEMEAALEKRKADIQGVFEKGGAAMNWPKSEGALREQVGQELQEKAAKTAAGEQFMEERVKTLEGGASAPAPEQEVGTFPRGAAMEEEAVEMTEIPASKQAQEAALDLGKFEKAQSDPKFTEFLARYADAAQLKFDKENAAEIVRRYEAFEKAEGAAGQVHGLYKSELNELFKIRLGDKGAESIREYLLNEAARNPEKTEVLIKNLERYENLKSAVAGLEKNVVELGGPENQQRAIEELQKQVAETQRQKETAEQFVGWKGFVGAGVTGNPLTWWRIVTNKNAGMLGLIGTFGLAGRRTEEEERIRTEVRALEDWGGLKNYFGGLEEKIEAAKKTAAAIQNLPETLQSYKKIFSDAKKEFFMNFEGGKGIAALINDRINKKLNRLVGEGYSQKDIAKLEDAQEYMALIQSGAEELGLPIELRIKQGAVTRPLDPEKFRAKIDGKIEKIAVAFVNEKIKTMDTKGPLNNLYNSLREYLERPNLGTKEKEEVKELFRGVVEKQIKSLNSKTKTDLKKLDQQILNLSSSDWLEKMNKKAPKNRRLTPAQAQKKVEQLMGDREVMERNQKLKAVMMNVVVGKLLNV